MIIQNKCSTEQWRKAITIKDISKLMNTSPRIVISVYLGNTDEALVQLHKRVPQELQGSKIDELIFWVSFEFDLNLDEHRWTILRKDK